MKNIKIKITGRVQGVGFRYSAQDEANRLGITGFARNEPDGSVYIEVEGEEKNLKKFLAWCGKGPWFASVKKIEHEMGGVVSGFDKFNIQ